MLDPRSSQLGPTTDQQEMKLNNDQDLVELNQGVCKGKEIAYFVKIYPE